MSLEEIRRVRQRFDKIDANYALNVFPLDRNLAELGIDPTIKLLRNANPRGLHLHFFPKTGSIIMALRHYFSSLGVIGVDINPHLINGLDRLFEGKRLNHQAIVDPSLDLEGDLIRQKYRSTLTNSQLSRLQLHERTTFVCDDPRELSLAQDLLNAKEVDQIDSATVMFPDSSSRVSVERVSDLDTLNDWKITERVGDFLKSSREKIFGLLTRMVKPGGVFVYGEECIVPGNVSDILVREYLLNTYLDSGGHWEVGDCSLVRTEKQPQLKTVRVVPFIEPPSNLNRKSVPLHRTLMFQQLIRNGKPTPR